MEKPPLMAITLHRPWPYAVCHLGKPLENRGWRCPLPKGSFLAIHAGKKFDKAAVAWIKNKLGLVLPPDGDEHPTGIVSVVRFMGNVTESDSPWFTGPYGWQLGDVVTFPAIPAKGQQGLWKGMRLRR
jgi:hypothetical protein